jgi:hypothetical protein
MEYNGAGVAKCQGVSGIVAAEVDYGQDARSTGLSGARGGTYNYR